MMTKNRRPQPYGWRQYNQIRRRFLARNVPLLLALALLTAATLVLQAWLADGYWLGLVHGSVLVSMAAMLRTQFWAHTGAFGLLLGGQGEDL